MFQHVRFVCNCTIKDMTTFNLKSKKNLGASVSMIWSKAALIHNFIRSPSQAERTVCGAEPLARSVLTACWGRRSCWTHQEWLNCCFPCWLFPALAYQSHDVGVCVSCFQIISPVITHTWPQVVQRNLTVSMIFRGLFCPAASDLKKFPTGSFPGDFF